MSCNILIIRLSSIGDIIHCTPVARSLKKNWPTCRITWLVGEVSADLIRSNPHVDEVIVWSRERFERHLQNFEWVRAVSIWRELQALLASKKFDIVLDIHGLFITGMIARQVQASRRIGMSTARECNSLFMTQVAQPLSEHIVDRYLGVLQPLGITCLDRRMTLVVPEASKQFAVEFLRESGAGGEKKIIVLIPGTTWSTKNWPIDFFGRLACSLVDDFTIVLCGGKSEIDLGRQIQVQAGHKIVNAVNQTGLLEMAAIIEQASLVIGGDTGPMHIAAALGVSNIILFGPTNPAVYGPLGDHSVAVSHQRDCSFCHKRTCPQKISSCMSSITPEEIIQQVYSILTPA